jgi:hypothetical protein
MAHRVSATRTAANVNVLGTGRESLQVLSYSRQVTSPEQSERSVTRAFTSGCFRSSLQIAIVSREDQRGLRDDANNNMQQFSLDARYR